MSDDVSCSAANAGTSATCPLLFNASTVGMTSSLMTLESQCAAGAVTDPPHLDITGSVTVESGVSWTLQLEEVTAPASLGSGPAYGTGIELGMASGAESYTFNGLVMPHVPAEVLQLKATLNQTLVPSDPSDPRHWIEWMVCHPTVEEDHGEPRNHSSASA